VSCPSVALVVQRYGAEVCGGAELLCRQVAERMARTWDVEVLTTCAVDWVTWRDVYPPGATTLDGVPVHRFPVAAPRNPATFGALSQRVLGGPHTDADARAWVRALGPDAPALRAHLAAHRARWDAVVAFTYLSALTVDAIGIAGRHAVLVPTAHDEPPIHLGLYDAVFRSAGALAFLSAPERDFVNARFGTHATPQDVVGAGVAVPADADGALFRARHAARLGDAALVLYAGRVDPGKGCDRLVDHFLRFRRDLPRAPVKLVLLGAPAMAIPDDPDVVALGFVDEAEKSDAMAAARVVVCPSRHESLSLAALEAWAAGTPVLANGACAILVDQCIRSDAGLWWDDHREFREALALLLADDALHGRLGAAGRAFVAREHAWDRVTARWDALVRTVARPRG
jgi:glycosyltransferase involved in cell wall biosynthesis